MKLYISGITFIRYVKNRKLGSNKTKEHKQNSKNRLWSSMPEGGEQ